MQWNDTEFRTLPFLTTLNNRTQNFICFQFNIVNGMSNSVCPNGINLAVYKNQEIPVGTFVKILPRTGTIENDFGGRLDLPYGGFYFVQQ